MVLVLSTTWPGCSDQRHPAFVPTLERLHLPALQVFDPPCLPLLLLSGWVMGLWVVPAHAVS